MRSSFLSLAFCLVPLFAPIGCTEEFVVAGGSGGGTASTTGGGGGAQTSTSTSSSSTPACDVLNETECDTCLVTSCADTYCSCAGDPGCVELFKCIADANGQTELEKCAFQHPNSISRAGRVLSCGSTACAVCMLPPVTACLACEYQKCGSQIDACLGNEACVSYLKCLQGCGVGDQGCQSSCYDAHQAGANPLNNLGNCATSKCAMECPAPK